MKSLLLVVLAVVFSQLANAQESISRAEMQRDMRDYSSAIATYEKVYMANPESHDVCVEIARCYVQMLDYLNASKWYEVIIDKEGIDPGYYLEYGDALKALRLYAKAKFYYQKYSVVDADVAAHFVNACDLAKNEMQGVSLYSVESVKISTPGMEFAPAINGDRLYFNAMGQHMPTSDPARSATNGNVALNVNNTLFTCSSQDPSLANVVMFDAGVKNDGMITHVRFSGNGKWVAFAQSDLRFGQRLFDARPGKMSLFIGKVEGDGTWSDVQPFPFNGNGYSTGYPSLSPDGSVLYFASTRPGGYGGFDLYVSFRSQDGWTSPVNLGNSVNTPGNEISPCYTDKKMYFSSDWHQGMGGFDIFRATSHDGSWNHVTSMGYPLNSPKDDLDVVWNETTRTGYFASNRIGSSGQYDIYAFAGQFEEVVMHVMDQEGRNAISGAVVTSGNGVFNPTYTDGQGKAMILVPQNYTGEVTISAPSYKDLTMSIKPATYGKMEYEVFIDKSLIKEDNSLLTANTDQTDVTSDKEANAAAGSDVNAASRVVPAQPAGPVITKKTIVVGDPSATSGTISGAALASEVPANSSNVTSSPIPVLANQPDVSQNSKPIGKYAVQVAALGEQSGMDKYQPLQKYGQVMQYPEKGMYKIRVGYYMTRTEANAAMNSIRSAGYPDAFIVAANPSENIASDEKNQSTGATEAAPAYMVRLGTYSRPEYFDASKVQHLGTVESRKSREFTIMLLTGFRNPENAEIAREGAIRAGFKDAHIAVEENGEIKRYKG